MWRYPFGSGGKRVCTLLPYLLVFRSSTMMSRMKLPGPVVGAGVAASDTDFDVLMRANLYLNWTFAIGAIYRITPGAGYFDGITTFCIINITAAANVNVTTQCHIIHNTSRSVSPLSG